MRVREWDIHFNTVGHKGKAKSLDGVKLQAIITEVESKGPLENRTLLFTKVADLYTERCKIKASFSTLAAFAKKSGLTMTTPMGRRGAKSGERLHSVPRGPRRSRADKFAANPQSVLSIKTIVASTPERFLPIAKRLAKGSMSAAVKLMCLDCTCHQTIEIKHCQAFECPLYCFRPYQGGSEEVGLSEPVGLVVE